MSDTIDIPTGGEGDDVMADCAQPQLCESGNQCVAMTAMANGRSQASEAMGHEFAAASTARTRRADQLSGDSQAMWSIAMTSPTVNSAMGFRTATQPIAMNPSPGQAPAPTG